MSPNLCDLMQFNSRSNATSTMVESRGFSGAPGCSESTTNVFLNSCLSTLYSKIIISGIFEDEVAKLQEISGGSRTLPRRRGYIWIIGLIRRWKRRRWWSLRQGVARHHELRFLCQDNTLSPRDKVQCFTAMQILQVS